MAIFLSQTNQDLRQQASTGPVGDIYTSSPASTPVSQGSSQPCCVNGQNQPTIDIRTCVQNGGQPRACTSTDKPKVCEPGRVDFCCTQGCGSGTQPRCADDGTKYTCEQGRACSCGETPSPTPSSTSVASAQVCCVNGKNQPTIDIRTCVQNGGQPRACTTADVPKVCQPTAAPSACAADGCAIGEQRFCKTDGSGYECRKSASCPTEPVMQDGLLLCPGGMNSCPSCEQFVFRGTETYCAKLKPEAAAEIKDGKYTALGGCNDVCQDVDGCSCSTACVNGPPALVRSGGSCGGPRPTATSEPDLLATAQQDVANVAQSVLLSYYQNQAQQKGAEAVVADINALTSGGQTNDPLSTVLQPYVTNCAGNKTATGQCWGTMAVYGATAGTVAAAGTAGAITVGTAAVGAVNTATTWAYVTGTVVVLPTAAEKGSKAFDAAVTSPFGQRYLQPVLIRAQNAANSVITNYQIFTNTKQGQAVTNTLNSFGQAQQTLTLPGWQQASSFSTLPPVPTVVSNASPFVNTVTQLGQLNQVAGTVGDVAGLIDAATCGTSPVQAAAKGGGTSNLGNSVLQAFVPVQASLPGCGN